MADKKMKILMTADPIGGVWTYAVELAKHLEPYNVAIALATMGGAVSDWQKNELKNLKNVELYESSFKLEWMDDPWKDTEMAARWLMLLKEKVNPDLIHLNNYCHGEIEWGRPVLITAHSCVLSWWRAVKGEEAPHSWNDYYLHVRAGLKRANVIVAPSESILSAIEGYYGPFSNKKVIYNGRNGTLFNQAEKKPYVVAIGRLWDEGKNIQTLLKAAPDVQCDIYIAGDGLTGQTEVAPNIHLLGKCTQEKIRELLAGASIYALPALYEPFGLSFLEAAYAGCALVAGDIPTLHEVWNDAAWFVPPKEPKALADAINELVANDEKRNALAEKAYERSKQFSAEKMAADYMEVYNALLPKKRRTRERRKLAMTY